MTPIGAVPLGAGSVVTVYLSVTVFLRQRVWVIARRDIWWSGGRQTACRGCRPAAPAELFATGSNLQGCEKVAAQETAIQTSTSRWKKFFREVKAELKKVTWPNKQELISYSGVVFVSVVAVAILIWIIDTGLNKALEMIIR